MRKLLAQRLSPAALAKLGPRAIQVFDVAWGQVLVAIATFAGVRFYTEFLSQAEFGRAMLAMGGIAFLDGLLGMALNQTLLSRCAQVADLEMRRQLSVGLAFLTGRGAAVVCGVVTVGLLIAALVGVASPVWAIYPLVFLVYACGEFTKYSLLSLLVVERKYRQSSLWFAGEAVLVLVFTALTLKFWRSDATGYVIGYIVARLVSATLFISLFSKNHFKGIELGHAQRDVKLALSYGAPVALMAPLGWIATYLDRYILGAMLGVSSTGAYAAATGLVTRPYALSTNVLSNYFRPQLYRPPEASDQSGDDSWRQRIMWTWLAAALCIGGGGALAFLILGVPITRLMLAANYRHDALAIMTAFACAQTLVIMTHAADNVMLAMGRSKALLKLQLFLSIGTLVLVPLGIFSGGILGAVIGRCMAECLKLTATTVLAISLSRRAPEKTASPIVLPTELSL